MEEESTMMTIIHFRELGGHRIVSAADFYDHKDVAAILAANNIMPDDSRFMLEYKAKFKPAPGL